MVSLKDIAAACGVSTATVSKALNDLPDISQERKELIRERRKRWDTSRTWRQEH